MQETFLHRTPRAARATFALNWALWLRLLFFINLSPETVIVSGDKSTLIMRPVFGEYYTVHESTAGII